MYWQGIDVGAILTMVLDAVLAIAIPALVAFLFAEGRKAIAAFDANVWAKLDAQQQALVESVVTTAVHMAEQIASRDDVKNAAEQKFAMANAYVNQQLSKYGITLTAQEVEAQIEAAVSSEFGHKPTQAQPPASPTA